MPVSRRCCLHRRPIAISAALAAIVALAAASGCGKKPPPARDPNKTYVEVVAITGVTKDKVAGVSVPGAKSQPKYYEAVIPRGQLKFYGSGRRGKTVAAPGQVVSGVVKAEHGRAEVILVGVEDKSGYYEYKVPPGKGDVQFDILISEKAGNQPFSLEIAPQIGGQLRLPFFVDVQSPAGASTATKQP
jgi:hypothetical protein